MRFWSNFASGARNVFRLIGEFLTEAIRWSNLGAIGRSNIGRLTILTPFVGYLIVFSPSFMDFFRSNLPAPAQNAPSWLIHVHSLRLSFLYFGLLSLGTGIGLFTLFAPEQVRKYSTISEYIADMENVSSGPLVKEKFSDIIQRFLSLHNDESSHPVIGESRFSFPFRVESYLHQLVAAAFQELPDSLISDDLWSDETEGTMVRASPYFFVGSAGHILTDSIMRAIQSGRLVDRSFREEMFSAAMARRKEVFFLDYLSANYSRFFMRFLVSIFIVIGFVFLLLPTFTTSALAAIATFR